MGSSSSKAARQAVTTSTRKYPARPSAPLSATQSSPSSASGVDQSQSSQPSLHSRPSASSERTDRGALDAADPDFARSLRSLGAVQPNPTLSPSSQASFTLSGRASSSRPNESFQGAPSLARGGPPIAPDPRTNPAIQILTARQRLADDAEAELTQAGQQGFQGRRFLDVFSIRQALALRDMQGLSDQQVEAMLDLKSGVMKAFGPRGLVEPVEGGTDWRTGKSSDML